MLNRDGERIREGQRRGWDIPTLVAVIACLVAGVLTDSGWWVLWAIVIIAGYLWATTRATRQRHGE